MPRDGGGLRTLEHRHERGLEKCNVATRRVRVGAMCRGRVANGAEQHQPAISLPDQFELVVAIAMDKHALIDIAIAEVNTDA